MMKSCNVASMLQKDISNLAFFFWEQCMQNKVIPLLVDDNLSIGRDTDLRRHHHGSRCTRCCWRWLGLTWLRAGRATGQNARTERDFSGLQRVKLKGKTS